MAGETNLKKPGIAHLLEGLITEQYSYIQDEKMRVTNLIHGVSLALAVCFVQTPAFGQQATWQPDTTIEIVAPAGPGGGWDQTARAIQRTVTEDKLVKRNVIVSNKPGGGGATGWTYLKGKEGNAHFLAVNSSLVLLNNLLGSSKLSYQDFTPLAMLTTEWISVAVKADSPIKSGKELMEALRKDPGSLTIGVGPSLGNNDHLSFIRVARQSGVDVSKLKWVVFEGAGGDVVMSVLGGHVGFVTTALSETLAQHKAGKLRVLAITADKRLDTLPDVPTWKEQGVDLVFPHWRGIMGPPGMTPQQIAYWDDILSQTVQKPGFKKTIENLNGQVYYKNSAEFKRFLDDQNAALGPLIEQLGLKKQ